MISERLLRLFEDTVVVPYAGEVDGQIITPADSAVHERVESEGIDCLDPDPRRVVCKRPFLAVGGELTTNMLDVQKDESTGAFNA